MVLHERERAGGRQRGPHFGTRVVPGVGQQGLELEIPRERETLGQVERASGLIERIASLAGGAQRLTDAVRIAHEKGREVDQSTAVAVLRCDLATPQHRARERLADGLGLGGVTGQRAEALV